VDIAYATPPRLLIDDAEDELGTHMCIPPHWEDRRAIDVVAIDAKRSREQPYPGMPRLLTSDTGSHEPHRLPMLARAGGLRLSPHHPGESANR
jgi:hypothetical protein